MMLDLIPCLSLDPRAALATPPEGDKKELRGLWIGVVENVQNFQPDRQYIN